MRGEVRPRQVMTADQPHARKLSRLRSLSHLLDNAIQIPGTQQRFGIDPLLGLIPGAGDVVAGCLSAYILIEAARMGVPRELLRKMGTNVLLEVGVGTVPLLGDLFDVTWKANARNVALLEEHLADDLRGEQVSPWFVAAVVLAILLVVGLTAGLTIWLVRRWVAPALS